ncbi:Acid phosphatase [Apiospora kogelbergensis]|uniref:Acid phosphatase n=1 Tax=Apiospora kogelbergensis TaxID=1337665 RepID=UPI00312EA0C9
MVSPGNHEAICIEAPLANQVLCPAGQTNFSDFTTRFGRTMPTAFASTSANASARVLANAARRLAKPPFWYSFEHGMAHVVMLDTETDFAAAPAEGPRLRGRPFGAPGQQRAFLAADLAAVDRAVTPWLVVAAHRPWYTTGPARHACAACRAAFEPLFYRFGVDLAVFGHVHNAQRFWPVVNGTADPRGLDDPKAPMYIVAGGAGNIEGLARIGAKPSYTAWAYADDFSYATVSFLDANRLQVDFVRSATGEMLDTSVLYKSHKERFVDQL